MKEDDLGGLGSPVGPVVSLVIVFWGGEGCSGGVVGAGLGRGWGSGVVCSYDVISCDWISFQILFGFRIVVESGDEVVFS